MTYLEHIANLISEIPKDILDIKIARERTRPPTQAFSEFLTNREQGDWAEKLIFEAIQAVDNGIIAVKYGKSDKVIAGEVGFTEFYEAYQDELDKIGKRPDLLIFKREDYQTEWNFDISYFDFETLQSIAPKAIAGIEVRSSSFLLKKYENYITDNQSFVVQEAKEIQTQLLTFEEKELGGLISIIQSIDFDAFANTQFTMPRNITNLEVKKLLLRLKELIQKQKKRDFLSFTPKMEDIKVVYKWIETYQVPHFYFQVFFDSVFGISFQQILTFLADANALNKQYFLEKDTKNQLKTTIKIDVKEGTEIAQKSRNAYLYWYNERTR
ncbi:MAG: AccI family restriction endonuclease [Bacteroidia bacterium]